MKYLSSTKNEKLLKILKYNLKIYIKQLKKQLPITDLLKKTQNNTAKMMQEMTH